MVGVEQPSGVVQVLLGVEARVESEFLIGGRVQPQFPAYLIFSEPARNGRGGGATGSGAIVISLAI